MIISSCYLHELTSRIDWVALSAVLSALSTVILTIITAFYARSTRQMLKESARQAAAAERSVEILGADFGRRIQQYRAPVADVIDSGLEAVRRWMAVDVATLGSGGGLESRELEVTELPSLIAESRAICFPLSRALISVESLIVETRYAIDELAIAEPQEWRAEKAEVVRTQLQRLHEAWLVARRELDAMAVKPLA